MFQGFTRKSHSTLSLPRALILLTAFGFIALSVSYVFFSADLEFPRLSPFTLSTSSPQVAASPPGHHFGLTTPEGIRSSVIFQYEQNHMLMSDPQPLRHLQYCSNPKHTAESSTVLVSESGDEGTLARIDFPWYGPNTPIRFNPSILPYPKGSPNPYFALARSSDKSEFDSKEPVRSHMVYCDMAWGKSQGAERQVLQCQTDLVTYDFPEWESPKGSCQGKYAVLSEKVGATDARLFFSPEGEPLMIVGDHGKGNCWSQYIIDLRMIIPDIGRKMNISHVPVRFKEPTELPRDEYHMIEKNWFVFFDEHDKPYVQRAIENRSISSIESLFEGRSDAAQNQNLLGAHETPKCIKSLKKDFHDPDKPFVNEIHQGSNSLRVTLCDFPCIPTIHNTVNIEIFQIKYLSFLEIFYRRYVVLTNITAPFNVVGRSSNIIYVGADEKSFIFTVSMTWDHNNRRNRDAWNDHVYGGKEVWNVLEDQEAEEYENGLNEKLLEPSFDVPIYSDSDPSSENGFGGHEDLETGKTVSANDYDAGMDDASGSPARTGTPADPATPDKIPSYDPQFNKDPAEHDALPPITELFDDHPELRNGSTVGMESYDKDPAMHDKTVPIKEYLENKADSSPLSIGEVYDENPALHDATDSIKDSFEKDPAYHDRLPVPSNATSIPVKSTESEDGFERLKRGFSYITKRMLGKRNTPLVDEEVEEMAFEEDTSIIDAYARVYGMPNSTEKNNLVNDYYHGWLDDTVMIHLGISDSDGGVMHVKARNLLDCLTLCSEDDEH
ncbi:hypothetical protein BZA70DRAFT_82454 [Myxozyma melibiosi]|uniref:Uncharacterized protein n=1 Tax=Myxozyma melibiosi TaxID=54550 RepID=A0ABR1EZV4_9ASCO